jgi:hypothetical protein
MFWNEVTGTVIGASVGAVAYLLSGRHRGD